MKTKTKKHNAEHRTDSKPKMASPTEIQTSMQEATPKNNRPSKPKQGQPKATSATENQTGMGENKNEKRTGQSDKL